jgi:hypothetical protein
VENFHPRQHATADGWARGTTFEFRGTRVTVSIPAEGPRQGTFKIARASADELVVDFLRSTGARDSATFRLQDERLHWVLGDGRTVVMRKAND